MDVFIPCLYFILLAFSFLFLDIDYQRLIIIIIIIIMIIQNLTVRTHYTSHGAARIDPIYVTSIHSGQEVRVETVVVTFTNYLEVCLRIKLEARLLQRGQGLWKMDTKMLDDKTSRNRFEQEWTRWRLQEKKITGHGYVVG
jgi:hypothetical protein